MPAYEHAQMKGGGGGGDDKPPKKKEWQGTARQPRKIKDTKSMRKATRGTRTFRLPAKPSEASTRAKRVVKHLFMD